jgi:hypothetical protein
MKLEMMFVAVSLILVVGIVANAIPSPAQATAKHKDQGQGQWCYTSAVSGAVCGFDSMVDCKNSADSAGPSVSFCGKALMSDLP